MSDGNSVRGSDRLYSSQSTATNALTSATVNPLMLFISIVRFGLLYRLLPLDVYGVLILLSSIVAQFNFMDGGLRQTLQRYIPEFLSQGRTSDVARAVTATLVIMFLVGAILGVAVTVFAAAGGANIFSSDTSDVDLGDGLYIVAVVLAFSWPLSAFRAGMEGFNRFNEVLLLALGAEILRTILVTGGALIGWSVNVLFAALVLPTIFVHLILALRLRGLLEHPVLVFDRELYGVFREIFHYSKWVALAQIGSTLNNSVDRLVVGAVLGIASVPIYYGLRQIIQGLSVLSTSLNNVILPIASHRMASSGIDALQSIVISGSRVQIAFFTPFALSIVLWAKPFLFLWSGGPLANHAWALQTCVVMFFVAGSTKVLNRAASALSSLIGILSAYGFFNSLVSLAFLYVLGLYFGVNGAFIGTMIISFFTMPVVCGFTLNRLNISVYKFLVHSILPGMLPCLLVFLTILAIARQISAVESAVVIVIGLFASLIAMLSVSFFFGIDKTTRNMLLGLLAKYTSKLKV